MSASPAARTLALLRQEGWLCASVERRIPGRHITIDLFGVADLIAAHPFHRLILLVQCTTSSNLAARLKKCRASAELSLWLRAGGLFQCWGWYKRGSRWHVRREVVDGCLPELVRPKRRKRKGERQRGLFDGA